MSKPSYEVLKRYRDKSIKKVSIDLRKELAEEWEAKLAKDNLTKAEFLRSAITDYLHKEDN